MVEARQIGESIKIYLDGYNGIPIKVCTKVSKNIRRAEEEIPELADLSIEVSSPGLDKPLILNKQFTANVGRLLEVESQSKTETGRLIYCDKEKIEIITTDKKIVQFFINEIEKALIQVDLNF